VAVADVRHYLMLSILPIVYAMSARFGIFIFSVVWDELYLAEADIHCVKETPYFWCAFVLLFCELI